MPRPRRTLLTEPLLHITSRGADRQDIFSSEHDRSIFEDLLAEAVLRHRLVLHAYTLMHNHVHLIVDRRDGDVSAATQHVLSVYARGYNARHDRTGPLVEDRFHAVEITCGEQLLQCSRYVHLNHLAFVTRRELTTYRWSSLGVYAGERDRPEWLDTGLVARLFHSSDTDYTRFVLTPRPADGPDGRPIRRWEVITLSDIDDVVDRVVAGRRRRRIAVTVALELRAAGVAEIAAHHGFTSLASVRSAARRERVHAADHAPSRSRLEFIKRELVALAARRNTP